MSLTYRERQKRMQIARATIRQAECFSTPDQYAQWLKLEGIRGVPNDQCQCPIANLLKQETGSSTPEVTASHAKIYHHEPSVTLGPVAAEFVQRFDAGQYPTLVKR